MAAWDNLKNKEQANGRKQAKIYLTKINNDKLNYQLKNKTY